MRLAHLLWGIACATLTLAAPANPQEPLSPLSRPGPKSPSSLPYTLLEQPPEICDGGSRVFAGTVNITTEKSMFFWYVESRRDSTTDPVVLWMSGGPGASGEFGLFKDIGPCTVNDDGNSTSKSAYSWADHANVIFIDQPIGVGFSHIANRSNMATTLHDGARDLYAFIGALTTIIPSTASAPWHITGESMGGHYVTAYTKYIMTQERERALQGLDIGLDIRSAIMIDGYIDASRQSVGYYDFFCADWRGDGRPAPIFNETVCAEMEAAVPACEVLGAACRESYDGAVCEKSMELCEGTVGRYYLEDVKPGGWDPYDSRHKCEEPPLCSPLEGGPTLDFLNQPWVQSSLGMPAMEFSLIDFELNSRWGKEKTSFLPATRELGWILDNTDVHVLFINGNNDIIINTPGQIRMLDEQPWKGQAGFRARTFEEWFVHDGELTPQRGGGRLAGTWKGDERLALYTVDEAGHVSPWDQPEAVGAVVRAWMDL